MNCRRLKLVVAMAVTGLCLTAMPGRCGAEETGQSASPASDKLTSEEQAFFETSIRPIFVEHCYECHSVDAESVEAGLLLDSKWGWQSGGDSGPAVVPGDVEESLLIHAVGYEEDIVSGMPPRSKLPDDKIALLRRWVERGAPDPRAKQTPGDQAVVETFDLEQRFREHWSWRPIQSPPSPDVEDNSWPRSFVDEFILAKLEAAGLKPAPPADRATWLRRVWFDLVGLPPTPEAITAFVADRSPDAHQRVVAELLDSQHFGEKWARHWMDLVRYAETYGHEFDYPIDHAYEYRDYLIRALNADVPYDQFAREHIAGDLIANPRRHPSEGFNESIIGTGFWYLHEATHAPTDVLGNEADIIDNQIDVFGKSFLGLTIACARCHDHKFDAISTADYYALSAYLQSSCRQDYPLDPGGQIATATAEIRQLLESAAAASSTAAFDQDAIRPSRYFEAASDWLRAGGEAMPSKEQLRTLANAHQCEPARLRRWIDLLAQADLANPQQDPAAMLALHIREPQRVAAVERSIASSRQERQDHDASKLFEDFSSGDLPVGWSTSGNAFSAIGDEVQFRIDAPRPQPGTIDSGRFGKRQAGILRSPTFTIEHANIHLRFRADAGVTIKLVIDNYQMARFSELLFRGTLLHKGKSDTQGSWQWKTLGGDLQKYLGHNAYLEIIDEGDAVVAIDEIRFSDRRAPGDPVDELASRLTGGAESLDDLWRQSMDRLRSGKADTLLYWLLDHQLISWEAVSEAADASLQQARRIAEQLARPRYVVAMAEGTREPAAVYIRGSHTSLGREVPPRLLEALGGDPGNRLELADRVASADNPLTARVFVNRIWHHLFGRGIVASVDDFGPQGQPPSHPDLLDRLAHEFITQGWSTKQLISELVLSQTYRQQSVAAPDLDHKIAANVDPENILLYHMRVRRLPAEAIRDGILAVSGRLNPKPFGPSVATHRTDFMTGRGARPSGPLDGDGRRSVYLSIYRNFLNPFLQTFDMPSPFGPKGRRSTSNVPAQALTLMNDPFVVEQSERWAQRVLSEPDLDLEQRIAEMIRAAHGVQPDRSQLRRYASFLKQQTAAYDGEPKRAWADLAHAMWNMKAFYYLR